jgi:peptidoglycan/LPS O-acetylase OafA/YrhL
MMVASRPLDVLHGVPYLVFLNAWPNGAVRLRPHSDPWWSLATEAQFYVMLPFLPLVLRTRRGRLCGLVVLLAYAAVYAALWRGWLSPATFAGLLALTHSVVGRGPLFLAGIAAAAVYDHNVDRLGRWTVHRPALARTAGDAALVAALVGLLWLLGWAARQDYIAREAAWPVWHVLEGALWAAVLLTLLLLPGSLKPMLVNRVWAFLGLISYSLYLVHLPVIFYGRKFVIPRWPSVFPWGPELWMWTWRGLGGAILLAAAAVALATLTYASIERPVLRLKSRVPT